MDALILSCGTGGGHDSAANAILEAMNLRGHKAEMLNPYTLKSNRLANGINHTYIASARHTPRAFGAVYQLGNAYRRLPFRSPIYFVNRRMNAVLQAYFAQNHFDAVIMTHLFPAEILTNMKRHGIAIPKTVFVATDYVCTPFTEETECDAYVIPTEDLAADFINRGIPKEKIYPFGIPTHSTFAVSEAREEAKRRLGLDADKKYILITGGSMGGGRMDKAIVKLRSHFAEKKDVELIIVCGSNQGLYDKLNAQADPGIKVIGYTDDMASFMKASNLFITKPGGLSSTEAAVCGIPVLHTSPIPGCESYNSRYFSENGMSISGGITKHILQAVDEILANEEASSSMVACQKRHINPLAAAQICELAEKLIAQT